MANIRRLGRIGEANIIKNTERIPSATGATAYRTPDILDHVGKVVGEVKNLDGTLNLTSQLKDDLAYAAKKGYTFELQVGPQTTLSGPLQQVISTGSTEWGNVAVRVVPIQY